MMAIIDGRYICPKSANCSGCRAAERKARRALYAGLDAAGTESGRGLNAEAVAAAELLGQERIPGLEVPPQAERLIIKAKRRQDDLFSGN